MLLWAYFRKLFSNSVLFHAGPNPPDFSIIAVTPTSITLTWTEVPGARVLYSLTVVDSTTGVIKAVPDSPFTTATTVTVQNLSPGTYYNLSMVAVSDVKSDPLTKIQLTGLRHGFLTSETASDIVMLISRPIACFVLDMMVYLISQWIEKITGTLVTVINLLVF